MEKKFDPEKVALAIVASSSYQMSISDKIQLYMDAYNEAREIFELGTQQPQTDED